MRLAMVAGLAALAGVCLAGDEVEWRHRGTQGAVTLTANPLTDAARTSFYIGRSFTATAVRPYASSCGFSFGMQNGGAAPITARLADWRAVGADGKTVRFRLPESWDAEWARVGVPQPARIAFRWAQFQQENIFEPGDWIMGMATLEARPAAPFRVIARYHDKKGNHEIVLDGLACAD